mmetsp:Transcript_2931/g.4975  ORF Transcript_2931/g.4975 Transcript_2931/m.4975 type:complete len:98 (+) Transcript_2931:954-1247(+)
MEKQHREFNKKILEAVEFMNFMALDFFFNESGGVERDWLAHEMSRLKLEKDEKSPGDPEVSQLYLSFQEHVERVHQEAALLLQKDDQEEEEEESEEE